MGVSMFPWWWESVTVGKLEENSSAQPSSSSVTKQLFFYKDRTVQNSSITMKIVWPLDRRCCKPASKSLSLNGFVSLAFFLWTLLMIVQWPEINHNKINLCLFFCYSPWFPVGLCIWHLNVNPFIRPTEKSRNRNVLKATDKSISSNNKEVNFEISQTELQSISLVFFLTNRLISLRVL